jgi:hypothetical protein
MRAIKLVSKFDWEGESVQESVSLDASIDKVDDIKKIRKYQLLPQVMAELFSLLTKCLLMSLTIFHWGIYTI